MSNLDLSKLYQMAAEHGAKLDHHLTRDEIRARLHERDQQMAHKWAKELRIQQADALYHQSLWSGGQPLEFHFEQWKPALQPHAKIARQVGVKAFRLAKRMAVGEAFNVFLSGTPGVGKTSLALAMIAVARKAGRSCLVVSTTALLELYDRHYEQPDANRRLTGILEAMKRAEVLLLDDFGTESGLPVNGYFRPVRHDMQDGIYSVANARYDGTKNRVIGNTIITSNNLISELRQMYDQKIISRLIPSDSRYQIGFNDLEDMRGKAKANG